MRQDAVIEREHGRVAHDDDAILPRLVLKNLDVTGGVQAVEMIAGLSLQLAEAVHIGTKHPAAPSRQITEGHERIAEDRRPTLQPHARPPGRHDGTGFPVHRMLYHQALRSPSTSQRPRSSRGRTYPARRRRKSSISLAENRLPSGVFVAGGRPVRAYLRTVCGSTDRSVAACAAESQPSNRSASAIGPSSRPACDE